MGIKVNWKNLPPEEKARRRALQREARSRRDKFQEKKDVRRCLRDEDNKTCAKFKPGDWMRYRDGWGDVDLLGKIVRFVDWDNEDGYNPRRAPRNRKVIIDVAPFSDRPSLKHRKLWGFQPVSEMQVIAEASR